MKNILITGASGFIGHHFIDHFLVNTDWMIYGISHNEVHRDRILNSKHYQNNKNRLVLISHDLNYPIDHSALQTRNYPYKYYNPWPNIDYIINLAGLSHVEDSINDPGPFVLNNIKCMINILEFARESKVEKFIHLSTDEIYGPMINMTPHKEWDSITPVNPYSGSKAAQEAIAISYWKTYGLPLIITNTMTVIGERQGPEKFLTKIINGILSNDTIKIHSKNGEPGKRSYLHARNVADAIMFILDNVEAPTALEQVRPERFNIVSDTAYSNLDFAQLISSIVAKRLIYELIDVDSVRPGQDQQYGLDGSKLHDLGYNFPIDFETSLKRSVEWIVSPENRRFLNI